MRVHKFISDNLIDEMEILHGRDILDKLNGNVEILITYLVDKPDDQLETLIKVLRQFRARSKSTTYCHGQAVRRECKIITDKPRQIIDTLYQFGLIPRDDKIALNEILDRADIDLQHYLTQSAELTRAQSDIIHSMIEPYCEHLITVCKHPYHVLTILDLSLSSSRYLDDFRHNISQAIKDYQLRISIDEQSELIDSCFALNKIYYDEQQLAKTLRKQGDQIPSLKAIRALFFDIFQAKVNECFSPDALTKLENFCVQFGFFCFRQKKFSFSISGGSASPTCKHYLISFFGVVTNPVSQLGRQRFYNSLGSPLNIKNTYDPFLKEIESISASLGMRMKDIPLDRLSNHFVKGEGVKNCISELPADVKELIFSKLSLRDKFNFARCSKRALQTVILLKEHDEWPITTELKK